MHVNKKNPRCPLMTYWMSHICVFLSTVREQMASISPISFWTLTKHSEAMQYISRLGSSGMIFSLWLDEQLLYPNKVQSCVIYERDKTGFKRCTIYWNMYTALFYVVLSWLEHQLKIIHVINLPIFIRVASLTIGQLQGSSGDNGSDRYMYGYDRALPTQNKTQQSVNRVPNYWDVLYIQKILL